MLKINSSPNQKELRAMVAVLLTAAGRMLKRNLYSVRHYPSYPRPLLQCLGRSMRPLADLTVKLFADGAEKKSMLELHANPLIQGFTTNPTLMRKAKIMD